MKGVGHVAQRFLVLGRVIDGWVAGVVIVGMRGMVER